jgi:hypothetical protein
MALEPVVAEISGAQCGSASPFFGSTLISQPADQEKDVCTVQCTYCTALVIFVGMHAKRDCTDTILFDGPVIVGTGEG